MELSGRSPAASAQRGKGTGQGARAVFPPRLLLPYFAVCQNYLEDSARSQRPVPGASNLSPLAGSGGENQIWGTEKSQGPGGCWEGFLAGDGSRRVPWPSRAGVGRGVPLPSRESLTHLWEPSWVSAAWPGEGLGQGASRAFPREEASGERRGRQKAGKEQQGQQWKWVGRG